MCLFTTEWTSIGSHCNGLFRTNKRTPYGWSWMPGLCVLISVHKICIADGLPWMPDPYRDPRTQNRCHRRHTVRIATGHRISVTILGDYCDCSRLSVDIALGHLHRCLRGVQFSGSGLFLDCVRMLSRGWISSQHTIPYQTIPNHTETYQMAAPA